MLIPIEVPISANFTTALATSVIEAVLPLKPLLHATLYLRNASSVSVQITLSMTVNLGVNVNPLFSGSYTNVLVRQTIPAGGCLLHKFEVPHLSGNLLTHSLARQALSAPGGVLIGVLFGVYEDVGMVPPPQLPVSL